MQGAECSLAEGEHGAPTLLGLAPPIFFAILTSAFKSATTPALTARAGRIFALDLFRAHGFLYCAIDCRLKAFGVGPLCRDLCSEWLSCDRRSPDIYFVAGFGHQLYTIRRKHLFAQLGLNPDPSRRTRFVTHISICHSFLDPQEQRLHPFRMDCLMAMGLGWVVWVVGDGGLWGVGGRVQGDRVPPLLSSTQILFSIFAQIKHKPTIILCFTPPSKLTPPTI